VARLNAKAARTVEWTRTLLARLPEDRRAHIQEDDWVGLFGTPAGLASHFYQPSARKIIEQLAAYLAGEDTASLLRGRNKLLHHADDRGPAHRAVPSPHSPLPFPYPRAVLALTPVGVRAGETPFRGQFRCCVLNGGCPVRAFLHANFLPFHRPSMNRQAPGVDRHRCGPKIWEVRRSVRE